MLLLLTLVSHRKLTSIEESINAHKILLYKEDDIKEEVVAINGENQVKKEEEIFAYKFQNNNLYIRFFL